MHRITDAVWPLEAEHDYMDEFETSPGEMFVSSKPCICLGPDAIERVHNLHQCHKQHLDPQSRWVSVDKPCRSAELPSV